MSKYAEIERERKFLIDPGEVNVYGLHYKRITDYYILNTSLRFRIMADNKEIRYKLTQKTAAITGVAQITTIYLNEPEFNLLNVVESVKVEKIRYIIPYKCYTIGLDKYINIKEELWIAEVEFLSSEEMSQFQMPIPFLKDVTHLPEYNGYELAMRFK